MRCNLDKTYANNLRGVINNCKYVFMYEPEIYCELCTILDRFEDTVAMLNNFDLPINKEQFNAMDFISWVNFANLIIECLQTLNDKFVVPNNKSFFQNDNIKMCGQANKFFKKGNDDDYFKFIRAIVLAHSLKIDAKSNKQFTGGLTAYAPLVRWNNTHDQVKITYYTCGSSINHEEITLKISNIIAYLEDRYSRLDEIFKFIEIENEKAKEKVKKQYADDLSAIPCKTIDKIEYIRKVHYKNGDIDIKNHSSLVFKRLDQIECCLMFQFGAANTNRIIVFKELVDYCLNDLIDYLVNQRDDFILNDLLSSCFNKNSNFDGCEYEVHKIVSEYCNSNQTFWYNFDFLFDKINVKLKKFVIIEDNMSNSEKALLTMVALAFDNALTIEGIRNKLPNSFLTKLNNAVV